MQTMRANVFCGVNDIRVEEVPHPQAGVGEAVIRIPLTTICGTDLHILSGEYPVKPGLVIGHEPVGVIEELGPGVTATKSGIAIWSALSRPAASARAVFPGITPTRTIGASQGADETGAEESDEQESDEQNHVH